MFSISNDELGKSPELGDTVMCPRCFVPHDVETSYGEGKSNSDPMRLHFYYCKGTAYLAGIDGKDLSHRFSKPGGK